MEKLLLLSFLGLIALTNQASISVMHPKELKERVGNGGEIRASMGNFGHVLYGTSIVSLLTNDLIRWEDYIIHVLTRMDVLNSYLSILRMI